MPFFEIYPGSYVPKPLRLVAAALALAKMNWNNTPFDGAGPITLRAAREVGRVLRYVPPDHPIQPSYAFYM